MREMAKISRNVEVSLKCFDRVQQAKISISLFPAGKTFLNVLTVAPLKMPTVKYLLLPISKQLILSMNLARKRQKVAEFRRLQREKSVQDYEQ